MQANNLIPSSTEEPTYWPSGTLKTPDLIVFAVVKGIPSKYLNLKSCLDLTSDHSPVIITFTNCIKNKQNISYLYTKTTDWSKYKQFLNENLTYNIPLKTTEDLEHAIEGFNILIHKACTEATPVLNDQHNIQKRQEIPRNILEKIQEKRKLRKIWQKTKSSSDKTRLNRAIKTPKKMLHSI